MRFILIFMSLALAACLPKELEVVASKPELPGLGAKHATQMTSQECSDAGGMVVGDIGDGRIHRSSYLCNNGEVPLGAIIPSQGEAIAVEGAVCCGDN